MGAPVLPHRPRGCSGHTSGHHEPGPRRRGRPRQRGRIMTRTIIDIHAIQTVPPSNINRDDTGSPKTAVYGGVRRARVSSQAWKRATRKDFETYLYRSDLGVRTKRVVELMSEEIARQAPDLEPAQRDEISSAVLRAT